MMIDDGRKARQNFVEGCKRALVAYIVTGLVRWGTCYYSVLLALHPSLGSFLHVVESRGGGLRLGFGHAIRHRA